jgi:hypothetical protein
MNNALNLFKNNINSAKEITGLYDYLHNTLHANIYTGDDLLRAQIVYAVSAFDKLMHDIIRVGMIEIFHNFRAVTPKYSQETFSIETFSAIFETSDIYEQQNNFEKAIIFKFRAVSYQKSTKIADGLSYIWNESHKWQKIAARMNIPEAEIKESLDLIFNQRNRIVHEADHNPSTLNKYTIDKNITEQSVQLLENCGEAIVALVDDAGNYLI